MTMAQPSPRLNLKRVRVLLVDDNHYCRELMLQMLAGYRIPEAVSCESVAEAHKVVDAQPLDLIIADAEMPGETGADLTRHIRSAATSPNFTTPIIIVSANVSIETVRLVRDAGANLVVAKPVSPSTLISRIDWLARSPRPFVTAETYCGPDRRFKNKPPPEGIGERRAEALALTSTLDRKMSQDEVDSLFG